jgi:hypothetical protein
MEVFRDENKIKINREIGRWATLAGLIVLIAGLVVSIRNPQMVWISMTSLVVGFFASAIGVFYANHWTRSPRADEVLDASLKGISNYYHIYHYLLPARHVLIGPAGVFVFRTYAHEGPITYDGKKWRQKFSLMRVLGFSGQEALSDPVRDAQVDVQHFRRWLARRMPEEQIPEITPYIVFVRDGAELDVVETAVPVLHYKRLKRTMRQLDKECTEPLDSDTLYSLEQAMLGDRINTL